MRARALDQRDSRAALAAQRVAQLGDKFESPCASADDDDAVALANRMRRRCHAIAPLIARVNILG